MKDNAIHKINQIGKITSIVTLVGKILVGISIGIMLLAAIIFFVFPKNIMKTEVDSTISLEFDFSAFNQYYSQEEIDEMKTESLEDFQVVDEDTQSVTVATANGIRITEDYKNFTLDMADIGSILLWWTLALVMTFVTLCFVGSVCKAFRDCQSPFDENVIKKMQYLAYSLIPWAVVSMISDTLVESLLNNKLSLMFSIDLGVILIVLVVLVLVYIFKYGAVLQQESDETL